MNLATHLERHHAVISRSEARDLGLTDRMISRRLANGTWVRMAPQVFRLAGATPTWLAKQRGAALSVGGLASHRSAARLHGIPGYGTQRTEVTIDSRRSLQHRPGVAIYRSKQLHLAQPVDIRGVPVTGIGRTVLDLASVVSDTRLEEALDHVVGQRKVSWPDLYEVLVRHAARGRNGCRSFRALLDQRYGDTELPDSIFNRRVGRLLTDVLLNESLRFEYNVLDADGKFITRVDLAFPEHRLAIECDSVKFHLNRDSFVRDRRRQNRLTNASWTVLNFTWWDFVDKPSELVATVRQALRVNSESGQK